jgi:hypothetical protein
MREVILRAWTFMIEGRLIKWSALVAKKTKKTKKKTVARRLYSIAEVKELRAHSKAKTPVERIAKLMKRSGPTLRQKARALGLPLGHRR